MDFGKPSTGGGDSPTLLSAVKFAALPHPKTGVMRAIISDASAAYGSATVGTAVTGGGSNVAPVFSNGVQWLYG